MGAVQVLAHHIVAGYGKPFERVHGDQDGARVGVYLIDTKAGLNVLQDGCLVEQREGVHVLHPSACLCHSGQQPPRLERHFFTVFLSTVTTTMTTVTHTVTIVPTTG